MAGGGKSGDWLLLMELFERAAPSFVDDLRRIDDADALGAFAPRWIADPRPEARRMLFDYLDRPLNAYRHEALVKRMFKLAEAAGDDELMARFLVCFDRSIRRTRGRRMHRETREFATEAEANALAIAWRNQGFESATVWRNWRKNYQVWGSWVEPVVKTPRDTAMPRGAPRETFDPNSWDRTTRSFKTFSLPDWAFRLKLDPMTFRGMDRIPEERRKGLERFRLYSISTRNYLRRRAWRYFRKLGKRHPERYVPAVLHALRVYRDDDVADGLALIDNWGLIHVLFHFSPALVADDRGWKVAEGHSLAELEPAPKFARLWEASPRALVDLLIGASCRPVRGWAIRMIRRDLPAVARVFPLKERLALLGRDDEDVIGLVADLIRDDSGLAGVSLERWMALVESAGPNALEILAEQMERRIAPEQVSLAQAVHLALARPLPLARLGLEWLLIRTPRDEDECRSLLGLVDAGCEPLRPAIVRWAREALSNSGRYRPEWVLEWLDSRHEDIRAEGWKWFLSEPSARDDATLWQRLMETPYDDVRIALVGELEDRSRAGDGTATGLDRLDPEALRQLWASVLLNIHRGGRSKPLVVRQLLGRIRAHPGDLPRLLPLLAVSLRSVRGPEWRAGLAAVVQVAERDEASADLVRRAFPELQWA